LTTDIDWLADLRCRADRAPNPPREALCIEGQVCGAVEPGLARRMQAAGLPLRQADDGQWAVNSPADESLHAMAHWLSRQGHGGRWRDELLAVTNDAGDAIARVERAAVRALGITTLAVHLVGTTASGMVWVQRRALDKAVDPGMLDTLVGGLVAAGEGIEPSLERETWEEAGLRLQQLRALTPLGRTLVRDEMDSPGGHGIQQEVEISAARRLDGHRWELQYVGAFRRLDGRREPDPRK